MTLNFESVDFKYPGGVQALSGISLTLKQGERVALVGENGAGKTTLAKHMNGLLKPTAGQVLVDGKDTREETVARLSQTVGYVFQNPDEQLFNNTVSAEVAFGPKNLRFSPERVEASVQSALEAVGLGDELSSHPYDLLPAQRKLLGLASVLAMDTPVLVLDEPTMGLDLFGIRTMSRVLQDLFAAGKTVVLISHDLDFCAEHVQRYIVMADGEIQEDAGIQTVFQSPASLQRSGLEAPQITRLAQALGMRSIPATVDDFVSSWEEKIQNE